MSSVVSALDGREAPGEVTIRETGLRGMITLRGELADKALRSACKSVTGLVVPDVGEMAQDDGKALCWMSPDELLILVPYADVAGAIAAIDKAMKGKHYLAANVSDARASITVEGAFAREVIAKLAPADLHPDSFTPGMIRRTRLAQAAAAFWMRDAETFEVICFRSVAEYVFDLLKQSAHAGPVDNFWHRN